MSNVGITGFGAFIPRLRLERRQIAAANAWMNPGIQAYAQGARAACNWDEDAVTMAVEAARDALAGIDRTAIRAVHLASTTLPFADRQNASVLCEALNLPEALETLDVGSSQRAATSALVAALRQAGTRHGPMLLVATEHRHTRTGTLEEAIYGDAAAAVVLGTERPIATLVASHSLSTDFVDHYRGQYHEFDYGWEERWIRDEGYSKIVPRAIRSVLEEARASAGDVHRFILPCPLRGVPESIARETGIPKEAVADPLQADCGLTGTTHPILQLSHALETARPGEHILVVGFGQGADALLFRATDDIEAARRHQPVTRALARRKLETSYDKFLTWNGLVQKDLGKRAEVDKQTALTTLYRNRSMLTGFVGGKCRSCGTVQFPKARYCVNPDCGALDSQAPHPMADTAGRVLTWTADSLTFSPDPPAYFGMVEFEGGGRLMVDFTDVDPATLDIGSAVRMHFRVREIDPERGFRKYFWKAAQV